MATAKRATSKATGNTGKRRMTKEEYMATLPPKLSKAGQWMLDHYDDEPGWYDVRAVMK